MDYKSGLIAWQHAYFTDLISRHKNNVLAAAKEAGVNRTHMYKLMARCRYRVPRKSNRLENVSSEMNKFLGVGYL
jgi:hypothetical protein